MAFDVNLTDVEMLRKVSEDDNKWMAWVSKSVNNDIKHSVIVDKIEGNKVYLRDPWPIEAVDEASLIASSNGVEAVMDIEEFAKIWSFGLNYVFKVKM